MENSCRPPAAAARSRTRVISSGSDGCRLFNLAECHFVTSHNTRSRCDPASAYQDVNGCLVVISPSVPVFLSTVITVSSRLFLFNTTRLPDLTVSSPNTTSELPNSVKIQEGHVRIKPLPLGYFCHISAVSQQ